MNSDARLALRVISILFCLTSAPPCAWLPATLTTIPYMQARAQAAAAAVGSRVYAIGGVDSFGARLATVECFEIQSAKWTYAPPLLRVRNTPRRIANISAVCPA